MRLIAMAPTIMILILVVIYELENHNMRWAVGQWVTMTYFFKVQKGQQQSLMLPFDSTVNCLSRLPVLLQISLCI